MRNCFPTWTRILSLSFVFALAAGGRLEAQTKLLRFPDLHGDKIVFTYAGDLWTTPAGGGMASRLTAHPGLELFGKFSPDGKQIAFTGQYDGDEQVYVIPASGGEPRQLTYYPARGPLPDRWGFDNQVYGWTPGGKSVLFRSMARAGRWPTPGFTPFRAREASPRPCRCPCRAAGRFPPTVPGSSTRRSPATSAPGSAIKGAGRRTCSSSTWPAPRLNRSRTRPTPSATRCGSATRSTSRRTAPAHSTSSNLIRPPRASGNSPRVPNMMSAGRAQATRAGSSMSWAAKSTCSTSARVDRIGSRSPCRPTPWPDGRPGSWSPRL